MIPAENRPSKLWRSWCDCGWSCGFRNKADHDATLAAHIAECDKAKE